MAEKQNGDNINEAKLVSKLSEKINELIKSEDIGTLEPND